MVRRCKMEFGLWTVEFDERLVEQGSIEIAVYGGGSHRLTLGEARELRAALNGILGFADVPTPRAP